MVGAALELAESEASIDDGSLPLFPGFAHLDTRHGSFPLRFYALWSTAMGARAQKDCTTQGSFGFSGNLAGLRLDQALTVARLGSHRHGTQEYAVERIRKGSRELRNEQVHIKLQRTVMV